MSEPVLTRPAAPAAGRPPTPAAPRLSRRGRTRLAPWLLLAPALTVIAVLLFYPLARVVWLSFRFYDLRSLVSGESEFVAFDNYAELLGGSYLWTIVLPNTVVFAVVAVGGTVVFGTLVALLLQTLSPLWRTVVIGSVMVAWAMPAVTGTYVWRWIFDVDRGIVRETLQAVGLLGPDGFNWFTERVTFYAIVVLNIVHHGFPFVAVTVLAGLLTIPSELHEAARIDGANAWQRFWNVTFPTILPVFAVVTILSTIWDFKVFAQVYLMPGGAGTNAKIFNFGVWSYVESFTTGNYGTGAAIAVLLTLMLLAITVVYLRALFRDEELR